MNHGCGAIPRNQGGISKFHFRLIYFNLKLTMIEKKTINATMTIYSSSMFRLKFSAYRSHALTWQMAQILNGIEREREKKDQLKLLCIVCESIV